MMMFVYLNWLSDRNDSLSSSTSCLLFHCWLLTSPGRTGQYYSFLDPGTGNHWILSIFHLSILFPWSLPFQRLLLPCFCITADIWDSFLSHLSLPFSLLLRCLINLILSISFNYFTLFQKSLAYLGFSYVSFYLFKISLLVHENLFLPLFT